MEEQTAGAGRGAPRDPQALPLDKANSDSLLMAYYIVTFLASTALSILGERTREIPRRSLSVAPGIWPVVSLGGRRLSLQAMASSRVMMDNGGASIKIRPEQYLSE